MVGQNVLQAGSSLSPQIPSESKVPPFLREKTLNFCTRVKSPCRAYYERFVVFFARNLSLRIFGKFGPTFPGEK